MATFTKFDWDPKDPRGNRPEPGESGHFANHEWLREFALLAYNELMLAHKHITSLEAKVKRLEEK